MQAQWNENSESLTYVGKAVVTADDAKTSLTPEKTVGSTQASPASQNFWRCARPELGVAAAIHPDRRRPANSGLQR